MKAEFQLGRFFELRRTLVRAAVVLIALCAMPKVIAQAAGSKTTSPSAQVSSGSPTSVTPASAPPEPSMMPAAPGTELDRAVAIVNGDLILDSDVDEECRFAAFEPYGDRSTDCSRDKAMDRLINRDLILQQIKLQPEDQVSNADVTKEINQLRKTIPACAQYHCETKAGWDRFLAAQGFSEASLVARWKQRMEMLQFIDERFRMGIQIAPEQIKNYYDQTLLPEYAKRHATPPKLEAISNQIQEVLLQQQVTSLLNDWLKSLRAQGSVVVLHPGEEAP